MCTQDEIHSALQKTHDAKGESGEAWLVHTLHRLHAQQAAERAAAELQAAEEKRKEMVWDAVKEDAQEVFTMLAGQTGNISVFNREQLVAAYPKELALFENIDADGDGMVTLEEST